jgi:hypothetical protein
MNEWEFLHHQKQDAALATIPTVVLSAAGSTPQGVPPAIEGYLPKPLDLNTLLHTVEKHYQLA